jgi:hypothetical protein
MPRRLPIPGGSTNRCLPPVRKKLRLSKVGRSQDKSFVLNLALSSGLVRAVNRRHFQSRKFADYWKGPQARRRPRRPYLARPSRCANLLRCVLSKALARRLRCVLPKRRALQSLRVPLSFCEGQSPRASLRRHVKRAHQLLPREIRCAECSALPISKKVTAAAVS